MSATSASEERFMDCFILDSPLVNVEDDDREIGVRDFYAAAFGLAESLQYER